MPQRMKRIRHILAIAMVIATILTGAGWLLAKRSLSAIEAISAREIMLKQISGIGLSGNRIGPEDIRPS